MWFCGLPGSGRSTIAAFVGDELRLRRASVEVLDDPETRDALGLNPHPPDPVPDQDLQRLAHVARLLARNGVIAIVASDSAKAAARDAIRDAFEHFVLVHVDTPAALCRDRVGPEAVDASPFEAPVVADVRVVTHDRAPAASAAQVVGHLESRGLLPLDATP